MVFMLIVFVHGWSVTNTDTYGGLPSALVKNAPPNISIEVEHLYLGKYVSFSNEVNVDDIARGMQNAVNTEILPKLAKGERFACITHSTGGPVVRKWIDVFFKGKLDKCPLQRLVMLAPANHGSALAQLGKGRLSRMKFFAEGVQPGTGVLNWLELGSDQSWDLNLSWLDYSCLDAGLYSFVLTGQSIDRNFYDNLNSYTDEEGSDGVVRAAAMFVFRITDDRNNNLVDYDVIFTAGPDYDENHLPPGFFVDRQRNQLNPGKLTYYIDYDVMADWLAKPKLDDKFGFKIAARPSSGYSFYTVAEHRGTFTGLKKYFEPNQTLMIEVRLKRHVMEGVFKLTTRLEPESFKDQSSGAELP
jgi:hypothetical protein